MDSKLPSMEASDKPTPEFLALQLTATTVGLIEELGNIGLDVTLSQNPPHMHLLIEITDTPEHGWVNDELTLQSLLRNYIKESSTYLNLKT